MKKSTFMIGGVILVLLLGGAAFIGARLLNGQGLPGLTSSGGHPSSINPNDFIPARELPDTPADIHGVFDHIKDNSIFVATGKVQVTMHKDASGKVQFSTSHSGAVMEVVVTTQTTVYHDTTIEQLNDQSSADHNIQQVVERGSLHEIDQNYEITVWGRKTGDRFIADVLVYNPYPQFITKGIP